MGVSGIVGVSGDVGVSGIVGVSTVFNYSLTPSLSLSLSFSLFPPPLSLSLSFPPPPPLSLLLSFSLPLSLSLEYISSFPLYMAVLQLLRSVKLVVRHTVCHQFISLLQLNPAHIDNIVSYPAWESLFLWLLCKQDSTATDTDDGSTLSHDKTTPTNDNGAEAEMTDGSDIQSHDQIINYSYTHWYGYFNEDDDVYRTFAVVTETIGYILWHQINQEGGLWLTWGHLLAALDEFTGKYPLIVPDFIVKQRYNDNQKFAVVVVIVVVVVVVC